MPPFRLRTPYLIALVFLLSLPAVTGRFYASDEVEYYAWLRSAAFDRDADFDNEYRHFYEAGVVHNDGFRMTFLDEVNTNGRRRNFTPIGTAVLWSPFFAAGHLVARLTGAPADGYSSPYIRAVTYASALYGFLALLLSASIARQVVGRGGGAAVLVAAGTPLVFYMYVAPGFSHACSAFGVALFLWIWLRVRRNWSLPGALGLGAAGALMAMVREQDVFFAVIPALDLVRAVVKGTNLGQALRAGAAGGAAFLATLAPQLVAYSALNGHVGPDETVKNKMNWSAPYGLQVLFDSQYGLFLWTPLAIVAIAGLIALAVRRPPADQRQDAAWIAALGLAGFLLQAYVSGSVDSWSAAGSFGQRRFVAMTPLFVLGLAALWSGVKARGPAMRGVLTGVVLMSVWWNLGLIMQFGLNEMDRGHGLTLAANARATFIDLPVRAPGIVWRYFTDRSSFYSRRPL